MLLRDFTSGAIPSSMCKVMCDLTMYELCKELKSDEVSKVKDSLANTFLGEFGNNIVEEYMSRLSEDVRDKFKTVYDSFATTLELHGFNHVLISSRLLEDQVFHHIKNSRRLFGPTLDNAVRKQIEYVANNFKVGEWDVSEHPNVFGLLHSAVTMWTDKSDFKSDKFFSNLQINIVKDSEGNSFISDSRLTEDSDTSELFSSEVYVEIMSSIYRGSAELFKLANSSTLKELLYSTINFYQDQELKIMLESTPKGCIKIEVDQSSLVPYKSKKNLDFNEGHLPHILKGYSNSGIGNESSYNTTFGRGLEILKSVDSLINNIDLDDSITFMVNSITKNWSEETYGSIGQIGVSNIIAAILDTRRLKDILSRNHYSLLQFPTIELRQNTWNRFTNFYELINYYRTHEKLDRRILSPEFAGYEQSEIINPGISITNVIDSSNISGTESVDKYIEEKFGNITLSAKTIIKSRSTKVSYRPSTDAEKVEEAVWITLKNDIVNLRNCIDNLSGINNIQNFDASMRFLECIIVPVLKYAGEELENYAINESAFLTLFKYGTNDSMAIDHKLQVNLFNNMINDSNIPDKLKSAAQLVKRGFTSYLNSPMEYYKLTKEFNDKLYNLQKSLLIQQDFYVVDGSGVQLSSINYINLMNYRLSKYLLNMCVELLMNIADTNDILRTSPEELADSVFNNYLKNLTNVILRVVKMPNVKSMASGNIQDIIKDFTNWYSKEYKLDLASMSRFREFSHFELHPYNTKAISIMSNIIKILIDYSDKFLYGNLAKAVKSSNSLSVWDGIKEYLNSSFLSASIDYLDAEVQQHTMTYKDDTFCFKACPTIPGTTIIADPNNLKRPYITETGSSNYWVYSNLGFKALVPSNIDTPIKMSEDERNNLIIAVGNFISP